ncbi:MAG: hypothetical protein ACREXY_14460, partial [Gammaproteobacteria bacterium]
SVFGEDVEIPQDLQWNANQSEARGYADASEAQQNTVKLATGYVRGGIDWWSEAKTPSRLGEATMNVLLARWEGEQLRPWADGPHGWAYSSVRVAERLIARRAEASSPVREATIEQVLQTLPNKGQWSVLLALDETSHGWTGRAWSAPRHNEPERLLTWMYDPIAGLRQLEESPEQEEEVV